MVTKVYLVFFSPCGTVRTCVRTIGNRIAADLGSETEEFDFTLPAARSAFEKDGVRKSFGQGDLVVFGTPTYAGRVPNLIMPYVRDAFEGNGALAVPVVLFGNRNYQDSLMELRNLLEDSGFRTAAAAAMTGEHSFTHLVAPDRPNAEDLAAAERFADEAAELVRSAAEPVHPVPVRGNDPVGPYYIPKGVDGKPAKFLKAKPKTTEACDGCGKCAEACPLGSISFEDPKEVPGKCMKCHACVRICPEGAKYFDDPAFVSHRTMLEQNFTRPAAPEFFLGSPVPAAPDWMVTE